MNSMPLNHNAPPLELPHSPMGAKLARMKMLRDQVGREEIVAAQVDDWQQHLAERAVEVAEALQQRQVQVATLLGVFCSEVNAINPREVVVEQLTAAKSLALRVNATQQEILQALAEAQGQLAEEEQNRAKLEQMTREYGDRFRSAHAKIPHERKLMKAAAELSERIATGHFQPTPIYREGFR